MIIRISGKVSDMFCLQVDEIDYDGEVISGLGIGGGDYIRMSIDTETGQIQDWKPFTKAQLLAIMGDEEEEF